jgi:hypothetical protein
MGEAASAQMQTEEVGEEGLGMGRSPEEVCGRLPGTREGGAGTVTGAGVGLRLQPHGIMGPIMEPAFNRNGRAMDGSGPTYVSRCARRIRLLAVGPVRRHSFPMCSARLGISKLGEAGRDQKQRVAGSVGRS